jgi:hypothetical protein
MCLRFDLVKDDSVKFAAVQRTYVKKDVVAMSMQVLKDGMCQVLTGVKSVADEDSLLVVGYEAALLRGACGLRFYNAQRHGARQVRPRLRAAFLQGHNIQMTDIDICHHILYTVLI